MGSFPGGICGAPAVLQAVASILANWLGALLSAILLLRGECSAAAAAACRCLCRRRFPRLPGCPLLTELTPPLAAGLLPFSKFHSACTKGHTTAKQQQQQQRLAAAAAPTEAQQAAGDLEQGGLAQLPLPPGYNPAVEQLRASEFKRLEGRVYAGKPWAHNKVQLQLQAGEANALAPAPGLSARLASSLLPSWLPLPKRGQQHAQLYRRPR